MEQMNANDQSSQETMQRFSTSLLREKRIAIIGGGPGGLTLARLLQMRGTDVTVYERELSPHARIQGSCLDLHAESGRKALQAAGLEPAFKRVARPEGDAYTVLDKSANVKFHLPPIKFLPSDPEIDRGDLRDILFNSLRPGTVLWNHHFLSLAPTFDGRYELAFQDGEKAIADLVIGCDGVHSKVRPYITDIAPRYSGVTLIQGEVENPAGSCPQIFQWVNKASMYALGDQKGILAQQKGDGHLIVYATAEQPEDWARASGIDFRSPQQVRAYLKDFFADWHPVFHRLFDVTEDFSPRPLYGTPIDQRWETKHYMTLIGDAAHVMPPFTGVGVNMAMQDALELADCLTSEDYVNIQSALVIYEKTMLARTAEAQKKTGDIETIFHAPDAVNQLMKRVLGPLTPISKIIPSVISVLNFATSWMKPGES